MTQKEKKVSSTSKFFLPAVFIIAILLSFGATRLFMPHKVTKATCPAKEQCVSLGSDRANPETLSVVNGTYVQFNSADGKAHELKLGDDKTSSAHAAHTGKFDSGVFKGDEAYRVKFTQDGAYVFKDRLNPKINIVVVVYTPGKDYTITR